MKIKYIYSGIKAVLKDEGVKSLISRASNFVLHHIFIFERYYTVGLYLKTALNDTEADFLPKIDNYSWNMISTNQEADELVANGFNFSAYELNLRSSLDRDVIVFCIFVGKELAHIVCLADNLKGQNIIDSRPFSVDFENGEIATGKALTVPKFRKLHLRTYSGYLDRQYCHTRGVNVIKGTVGEYNVTLLSAAKDGYLTILSKCQYVKSLWYKNFKEQKIEPTKPKQILEQKQGYKEKIIKKVNN